MSAHEADVVVVGGGPSGVAAALEMRRRGVKKVVILDREPHLGGATRHCMHSPFGMLEFGRVYIGASYGQRLEREVSKAGVDVRTGHSVVAIDPQGTLVVTSARGVESFRGRRIMIATGAREAPRSARLISGERPVGVVTTGTLQTFVAFHGLMPFRRPVIVGSELVSMSALITCRRHGASPVLMVERFDHPVVPAPFSLFPRVMGISLVCSSEIVDIVGRSRVEAVTVRGHSGQLRDYACDGLLLTGQFTPESALFLNSTIGVDRGSAGPAIDQNGRTSNPLFFSAGNILRAVETGGWSFREGRAIGAAIANDLASGPDGSDIIPVTFDDPIKLVVPTLLRHSQKQGALTKFQLRFVRRAYGELLMEIDGVTVWSSRGVWMPERRVLIPIPLDALQSNSIHFSFREAK